MRHELLNRRTDVPDVPLSRTSGLEVINYVQKRLGEAWLAGHLQRIESSVWKTFFKSYLLQVLA